MAVKLELDNESKKLRNSVEKNMQIRSRDLERPFRTKKT